ncbi:unnamed protein product [Amaranthus hypochondriacus]
MMTIIVLVLCLIISSTYIVEGRNNKEKVGLANVAPLPIGGVFDVTKYHAVGDGSDDTEEGESSNAMGFIQAWRAACDSSGVTRVIIPKGNFVIGPVLFSGPCKSKVTVEIQGNVLANTDISLYPEPFVIMFENVNDVTLTGNGIVDGQGAKHWGNNDCSANHDCAPLPTSIKFHRTNNTLVEGVKSINPMFFHMFVSNCQNVTIRGVKLEAPFNSPNTDGIHIGSSEFITVANTIIGTGDDCVSIGHGSKNINVLGVTCGPGHGISVGSLGKYKDELEVVGVVVKNCTLSGTTNGARIKSWPGNKPNKASAITFEDIIMDHVKNPIIIDQQYGKKASSEASHVKISDVHFRNIRGTSATTELVTFDCSPLLPCTDIEVADVSLTFDGKAAIHKKLPITKAIGSVVNCLNAKVVFKGKHDGINC